MKNLKSWRYFFIPNLLCKILMTVPFETTVTLTCAILCNFILWSFNTTSSVNFINHSSWIFSEVLKSAGCPKQCLSAADLRPRLN